MINEPKRVSGAKLFNSYAKQIGVDPFSEQSATMAKLLTDLMHFADEWKIDFAACVAQANAGFDDDIQRADDER